MAQVKVYYEPETELLTIFWQAPRKNQICTELDDGVILIKDEDSGEAIGFEIWSYRPGDRRLDSVNVEIRQTIPALTDVNYIERFNCTMRQRISRLVQKRLSFFKKIENHIEAICFLSITTTIHPYLFS